VSGGAAGERVIRLGVVGLGRAFTLMLPTFVADPRVQLVAACDPRPAARAQFAGDFAAPVYERVEELADHAAIDAVYIASPHQLHAEHACIAASRGKHVLSEKPMALTLADCDAMIEACTAAGVRLVVGHCHSFDAPYALARRIVSSGEFGRARMILAFNYTDFLYRPRRPEELSTAQGGGAVFSQAAHQVDIVRLLAGSRAVSVRAATGAWDSSRPTEGAYAALLQFENGAFASIAYSGHGHFDSDAWCGGVGEMGQPKRGSAHGAMRRRLRALDSHAEEARLKSAATYGGPDYQPPAAQGSPRMHQHFGPVIVTCERADLRPLPNGVWIDADDTREHRALPPPAVPRSEVIDELHAALFDARPPLHDGLWGKATLEICLALLESARTQRDVVLRHQVEPRE
jgi:phthalate 4,5-cis-dihydrodiol dehydrogenase